MAQAYSNTIRVRVELLGNFRKFLNNLTLTLINSILQEIKPDRREY
ncbi:hypothetical protein MASSI9I_50470 [Massilia sp. 9I]|nr:hypothetical protein MASSI9I_50470 [Massilia sp. 9I]